MTAEILKTILALVSASQILTGTLSTPAEIASNLAITSATVGTDAEVALSSLGVSITPELTGGAVTTLMPVNTALGEAGSIAVTQLEAETLASGTTLATGGVLASVPFALVSGGLLGSLGVGLKGALSMAGVGGDPDPLAEKVFEKIVAPSLPAGSEFNSSIPIVLRAIAGATAGVMAFTPTLSLLQIAKNLYDSGLVTIQKGANVPADIGYHVIANSPLGIGDIASIVRNSFSIAQLNPESDLPIHETISEAINKLNSIKTSAQDCYRYIVNVFGGEHPDFSVSIYSYETSPSMTIAGQPQIYINNFGTDVIGNRWCEGNYSFNSVSQSHASVSFNRFDNEWNISSNTSTYGAGSYTATIGDRYGSSGNYDSTSLLRENVREYNDKVIDGIDKYDTETPTLLEALEHIYGLDRIQTKMVDSTGREITTDWSAIKLIDYDPYETDTPDTIPESDIIDLTDSEKPVNRWLDHGIKLIRPDQQTPADSEVVTPEEDVNPIPAPAQREDTSPDYKPEHTYNPTPDNIADIPPASGGGGNGGVVTDNPTSTPIVPIIPPIIPLGGSSKLFTVYKPTQSELDSLGGYLWSSNIIDILAKFFQNPMDAIISLNKLYLSPDSSGRKNIKLGYLDSGVSADVVDNQYISLNCGVIPVGEFYGDARDYSPWTTVQIYLPFIGIQQLSSEDIIGSNVAVNYVVDVYTGSCLCNITVTKPNGVSKILYTYSGNCAVQYPLTGSNLSAIVSGFVNGAMAGSNVGGLAGAVVGGLAGGYSGGASIQRSNSFGTNAGAMGYKKPYIIVSRKIPDDAVNYNTFYGHPANKSVVLNMCNGYTRVKSVHVENIPNSTDEERNEIETLLKQGVIIK